MNGDNKKIVEEVKKHFDERTVETKKHFDERTAETKKHFDERTVEIKRHFDVTLEEINGRLDAFAEGQEIIKEKVERIDLLETKVDSLIEDMDYVKSNLVDKTDRFKEIDAVTNDHEKRLIKLENQALAEA